MSILDEDLTGTTDPQLLTAMKLLNDAEVNRVPYAVMIARAAEWNAAVLAHRGVQQLPLEQWKHIICRCFSEERRLYGTTRNALEDRRIDQPGQPGPGPGTQPTEPDRPIPSQPGRLHRIPGPFRPRMYSYWANSWVNPSDSCTYTFGGRPSPIFFRISPDGTVNELGPMVRFGGETEGWYWDRMGCVYIPDGRRLFCVSPFDSGETVMLEAPGPIWQAHSSLDGKVHSATLKDPNTWAKIATIVQYRGKMLRFDTYGELDESIITKDGEWLIIQEAWHIPGTPEKKGHNRIIRLATQEEYIISQWDGAVGHCDTGSDVVIGEDDEHGACVVWNLATRERRELWKTWNMGHVSFAAGKLLSTDNESLTLVNINTGAMQHVLSHGIRVTSDYDTQVRANLSPSGKRATFIDWQSGEARVLEL